MAEMSHLSENTVDPDATPILFFTPFNYLCPDAARMPDCLLDVSRKTVEGLISLGEAMGDPGSTDQETPGLNSKIPSIFTYFGQFIDHDLTIRTDGDGSVTVIEKEDKIVPIPPDTVVAKLKNGRRPYLDLDSVYGDGPSLAKEAVITADAPNTSDKLFDNYSFKLHVGTYNAQTGHVPLDLVRISTPYPEDEGKPDPRKEPLALIADERNDENLNVSQIHASFLHLHNIILDVHEKRADLTKGSTKANFIRARQLVRWTYQYIVANQYLPLVCDSLVVEDILVNGPRYLGTAKAHSGIFMPLEFSVAAFRFGHSMIRPFYDLNDSTRLGIMEMLLPSHVTPSTEEVKDYFEDADDGTPTLKEEFQIDWPNYLDFGGEKPANLARKIDPLLAVGLFDLPTVGRQKSLTLKHLAISNLLRGYSLSIPTGQAACQAFGLAPLEPDDILAAAQELDTLKNGEKPLTPVLEKHCFHQKTPLWFYILLEAHRQRGGKKLGALGSRILCETLIGLIKADPNSYLNARDDLVTEDGIDLPQYQAGDSHKVGTLQAMLGYTGLYRE